MANVSSLHGGAVITATPNQPCIDELERILEAAKSGDIIGFVMASVNGNKTTSYTIAGIAGGFPLVGAIEMAKQEIVSINKGFEE